MVEKQRERVTRNILQELSRSGVFKRMYLFSNDRISKILGDVPLSQYYSTINDSVSSIFHTLNYLKNNKPLMSNFYETPDHFNISTYGIMKNLLDSDEEMLYDIRNVREKKYYFFISEKTLQERKDLLQYVSAKINQDGFKIDASYAIYQSDLEEDYVYIECHTNFIQKQQTE